MLLNRIGECVMIIVDRIENGIAVIEGDDGAFFQLPASQLPDGVREGSVLRRTQDGFALDSEAERERRHMLYEKTKRLFGNKQL